MEAQYLDKHKRKGEALRILYWGSVPQKPEFRKSWGGKKRQWKVTV